jgi:hypothetical protein
MRAVPASVLRATLLVAALAGRRLATGCEGQVVGLKRTGPAPAPTRNDDGQAHADVDAAAAPAGLVLPDAAADHAGAPACVAEAHEAAVVPVDLFMLLDVSGSMLEIVEGGKTKWDLVRAALTTFFADPRSAGLGIGLQFFPLPAPCQQDLDCSPQAGPKGFECRDRGICWPPGARVAAATMAMAKACDSYTHDCPVGTTCRAVLTCSRSRLPCVNPGQPCSAGMADDLCEDPGLRCVSAQADGCMPELYAAPALPVGELPGWRENLALTLASVTPGGSTPMAPALAATFSVLHAHAIAHPGRKPVLVLATDGFPTGCGPNTIETVVAAIEAGRTALPVQPTYVIGVFADAELVRSQLALSRFATAGGTVVPFLVAQDQDLAQKFLAALEQIRGSVLACEFSVPRPAAGAPLDFAKVNVRFTPVLGTPDDLFYVAKPEKCDPARGGWYYDVDPAAGAIPTRILMCPATCKQFKSEAAGKVELQVGCTTRID